MGLRAYSVVLAIGAGLSVALVAPALQRKFSQRDYDRQSASAFLFVDRPFHSPCVDRPEKVLPRPGSAVLVSSSQFPYARTHLEHLSIPVAEAPSLTVTADGSAMIQVAGREQADWAVRSCVVGEGASEAEAQANMERLSLVRNGALVSAAGGVPGVHGARSEVTIDGPENAPVTVYAAWGAIAVHDMAGTVRTAAAHGRTTILNSSGRVDASGYVIDFAGDKGTVFLDAATEINLKLNATTFHGTLSANADRAVRVLVPQGFATPLEARVANRKNFVCRADFCSHLTEGKEDGIYVFRYAGNEQSTPSHVNLRSANATVVIDTTPATPNHRGQ